VYISNSYDKEGLQMFLDQYIKDYYSDVDIYTAESENIFLDFLRHENAVCLFGNFREIPELEKNGLVYRYIEEDNTYYYYLIYNTNTAYNFYQTITEIFYLNN